jgi:putative phage-type endonuclease
MLNDRSKFIGGSDIAAVMGVSRWQTPLSLWAEKTGKVPPKEMSEAMELGTELEDFVARKFSRKTGLKVRKDSKTYEHPNYPYLVAHIDRRVVGTDEILEVKTCGAWKAKEWEGEEIPVEYVLQCNFYLGILAKEKCWLAILVGGQKFLVKHVSFDEELFRKQVEAAINFWEDCIQKDQPPLAIAADNELLVEMFPEAGPALLEIEDPEKQADIDIAIERRFELLKEQEAIKEEKETIEAKLKQIVKDNSGIKTARYELAWPSNVVMLADPEKLKEDGIFEKYSKPSPRRTLRVKKIKEEKNG